jgi:hypothetical protein
MGERENGVRIVSITILTTAPVLTQPNPRKPFKLEVDTSDYATGAILF